MSAQDMPAEANGSAPDAGTSLGDQDYQDQAAFRRALRRFLHFSEEQARRHGIMPQQHLVLLFIRGNPSYPNVTVGDVAQALQIRHHSASLLIDRCVKRGLVNRMEDPRDRRRMLLSLTAAGEQVLKEITLANRHELAALNPDLFQNSLLGVLQSEFS